MKWTQNYLSIGVLFIILGIILLVISSEGIEGSVFFIFPFFFFSGSDPIGIFIFLTFIIFMFVIMLRTTSDFVGQSDIPVGSKCEYCSTALPVNASFCPSCGNTVDYDTMSDH